MSYAMVLSVGLIPEQVWHFRDQAAAEKAFDEFVQNEGVGFEIDPEDHQYARGDLRSGEHNAELRIMPAGGSGKAAVITSEGLIPIDVSFHETFAEARAVLNMEEKSRSGKITNEDSNTPDYLAFGAHHDDELRVMGVSRWSSA